MFAETLAVNNILVYNIIVTGMSDGSILDADCVRDYTAVAEEKTASMVGDLNAAIVDSLCGEDSATVVAHTQMFAGLGSQVCYFVIECGGDC